MLQYDRKKLGEHLKEVRIKANLTQAEVSKRLGHSSPQFVSNIERGVCVAPLQTLAKMSKLYKSDPNAIAKIITTSQKALLIEKLKKHSRI